MILAPLAVTLVLGGSHLPPVRDEPPPIPIGYDAYRYWEKWAYLRYGERVFMRSTYDRRGGNEGADASHFLYQLADDDNVTLDLAGQGVLSFVRTNHWHGSPWQYVVDGAEHIVSETSTADPDHPVENSTFLPPDVFAKPLAWTWSDTRGADLSWVPIPFQRSLRIGYSRTHYGTGYYIGHLIQPGARLSRPLTSWKPEPPPADVVRFLDRAGQNISPLVEGYRYGVSGVTGLTKLLPPHARVPLYTLANAPSQVRAITFTVPREDAIAFGRARLRVWWDGRAEPSIDAPIALFFGAGTLYNRDGREYLVKALPAHVRFMRNVYGRDIAELACYFPMPFFKSARFELAGGYAPVHDVTWSFNQQYFTGNPPFAAYFHATYRDHENPAAGRDLVLLDTRGVEGSRDWSGHLVGTSFIFSHRANLGTLEGDPRFFFDDSQTPQAQGTGTEEWCGGGDYWGGRNMTLPLAGHPTGAPNERQAQCDEDKIESAYRFLLADLMPFGRNARIQLEHGGTDESTEHYETVTYWYGIPQATLVRTDSLHVGERADEKRHGYSAIGASAPYRLTSRYEWGVDTLHGREAYPARTDCGRAIKGESSFVLRIDPSNVGVMMRRTLDYAFPNQRAEVFVSDVGGAARWRPAGVWYLAGSNTCVYSNPPSELGAAQHIAETSNRRLRDDEFLIPRDLTRGRSAIRMRFVFTPVRRPLFPGGTVPKLAWSETRYVAYSYVLPRR